MRVEKLLVAPVDSHKIYGLPGRHYDSDCGYDLFVSEDVSLSPGQLADIPTNICICLPNRTWGLIIGRSSTFRDLGVLVLPAVIDNGYRGPLFSITYNTSQKSVRIQKGDRIAQLVIMPLLTPEVEVVDNLPASDRGGKGFGSSGR